MSKEPYVKPEIKSEVLEPGALGTAGSGGGGGGGDTWGPSLIGLTFGGCCSDW